VIELSRQLAHDDECVLYRARSEEDGSEVLVLTPAVQYPAPDVLKRLEHEYSLREELDREWAVRPLALNRRGGQVMLVLEDPSSAAASLDRFLRPACISEGGSEAGGQPMELGRFLRLAVNLAAGLGKLHRRGLIHKDIKPTHILVDLETNKVWFTGFGISSRLARERQAAEFPEVIAGTLAYMAPEQTGRMNRSIDSRSDLYSLGVIFYQMLSGALPFTASDPMDWCTAMWRDNRRRRPRGGRRCRALSRRSS
jgi:serine/threonine protein kinase